CKAPRPTVPSASTRRVSFRSCVLILRCSRHVTGSKFLPDTQLSFDVLLQSLQEAGQGSAIHAAFALAHHEILPFVKRKPVGLPPLLNQLERTGLTAHLKYKHADSL